MNALHTSLSMAVNTKGSKSSLIVLQKKKRFFLFLYSQKLFKKAIDLCSNLRKLIMILNECINAINVVLNSACLGCYFRHVEAQGD